MTMSLITKSSLHTNLAFAGASLALLLIGPGVSDDGHPNNPSEKSTETIRDAPEEYDQSEVLEKLDLAIAKAKDPTVKSALDKMRECAKRGHSTLSLRYDKLTSLPPEIKQLKELWSLDLGGNKLTKLLPEIGKLTELTDLALNDNPITDVASLKSLVNLRDLSIKGIKVTKKDVAALQKALPLCTIR